MQCWITAVYTLFSIPFSVSDATVGSEQIKHAGQAMHEPGIPVVCRSDTSVSGAATYVSLQTGAFRGLSLWGILYTVRENIL